MPSPSLPQRLIPLLSTLLTTASLSAQEPTAAATRPSPEQRLSTIQAETKLPSPAPSPIDFRSPIEPTRPLPEMRLLAQATAPTPTPGAAGTDTPTTPTAPGNTTSDTTTPPPAGPGGPGGDRPRFGGPRGGGGFGPGGGMSPTVGQDGIETMIVDGDKVKLQFPNNPVEDLLNIYERLTSMTLVKDTGIFEGATISLVTPIPVEKTEAIRLIEAALLTNGYAIVIDPGGTSARVLPARTQGATAVQFSHGVTLYQSAADIPKSETLVSYFMALDNLAPEDAATILANHVGLSIYGRMTPVTTPPGLLITESATIVRQLISIKDAIDSPSTASDLITKFIPLEHADATVVAQIVQATVTAQAQEQETKGITTLRGTPGSDGKSENKDGKENKAPPSQGGVQQMNGKSAEVVSITAQVVADARLNQVLVVAAPEDYTYIASLIAQFDQPLELELPYERPLKYASAVDILSALVDVLQESSAGTTQLPGGGSLTSQRGQALTSSSAQLLGGNRATNSRGGQTTATGGATDDLGTGTTSSVGSRPDLISGPTEDNAPVSVIVDKTRIVADPMANAILVMGRKENIAKIDGLIDKLDRKPAQVYLSTVIGQLTLGEGMQSGVDYLTRFNSTRGDASGTGSLFVSRDDIITNNNITDLRDNLITSAFGPATGLNLYGALGDSVDVFVTALETSNRFKVLSRPAVFALNNKKATITSGKLIPVPSQSTTFANNTANGSTTTTIEYRDVVLKLEVVPLINADGEVNLTIAQVNDTVVGSQRVEPNDIPIIGTEQIVTSVTVPNGKTIVLGGLISEEKKNDRQGLPYISRVPLLGKLFRQDIDSDNRRELIIFIQPKVVTDNMSLFNASNQEDRRTDVGSDLARRFPQDLPQEYATPQVTVDDTRKGFFSRLFRRPAKTAPRPLQ